MLDVRRRALELAQPARTDDVKAVIKEMQKSPTAAYLRERSFLERVMLTTHVKCVREEGVGEIRWSDVSASLVRPPRAD